LPASAAVDCAAYAVQSRRAKESAGFMLDLTLFYAMALIAMSCLASLLA
jgi:hypothetical protein